jgi:hypothetical protein
VDLVSQISSRGVIFPENNTRIWHTRCPTVTHFFQVINPCEGSPHILGIAIRLTPIEFETMMATPAAMAA